ncbi:pilin N-terminal domain-containing protein [Enterococcus asini]|uniref:pilin N-terminal domain-containing protein n=1 Tax=Enterococcus asini TaxID=57732 RepID=UPI0028901F76|nr:pilin N-terminal domain-containing protein [Enterococcus asini]MDT2757008.1 pilin N-terminal domain-containing protein [Enterococcus asini]
MKRWGRMLLLPFFLFLFFGQLTQVYGEEVTVVLHKRLFRDIQAPKENLYINDGLLIDANDENGSLLKETFGLNGANFTIYDATSFYQNSGMADETFVQKYSQELSRKEALALIKDKQFAKISNIQTKNDWNSSIGGTREDGIARVNLPSASKRAYLFIEESNDATSSVNVDLEKTALPMMLLLPQYHPVNGDTLSEIHLYPKNVVYVRNPYFFKYGKDKETGTEAPLAGTKFVLYQVNDQGEKQYLTQKTSENLQNEWLISNNPVTDSGLEVFSSDKDGLVTLNERFLPAGEYYFEEIQTVSGYQIDSATKAIKVEIPQSWHDEVGNYLPVMTNGQATEELISSVVPQSVYQAATPRVYNYRDEAKSITPVDPSPDQRKPGMLLPQTSMEKGVSTLIGLLLIFSVAVYWVKQKKRGTEND